MSEHRVIAASASPVTAGSLSEDLRALGLSEGGVVLAHTALSSLGWVCGGAVAVVTALLEVLGPAGTLVVPTHSSDLSDPAEWGDPPVPEAWWDTIRSTMPAYRASTTPTRGMGAVPEVARTWPGALRSDHPQLSFAAVGPAAAGITADHGLVDGLGEPSPLARLYDLGATVLLLGVGHDRNTSLHLAEYRSGVRSPALRSGPVVAEGRRTWRTWEDIDLDPTDFPALGADLELTGVVDVGRVGHGVARSMSVRAAVDFGTAWLRQAPQVAT